MTYIRIMVHIAALYGIFWIGNTIQHLFHLFIPGSIIGMVFLFILLSTNIIDVRWVEAGMQFMVKHLSFFFIPATVGIISYFHLFNGKGAWLIAIVLVSTVLVMAGSSLVSQWLIRRKEMRHG
ncbi:MULTISPECIES: CidA/LrgA family protein [unclassified Virgibacillus]|uniref:CidA/LrgA family protein n=1 Tax=unclassified Virgibacillus TaxID=2620237 RepID=UPI0024DEFE48|nr:CidA/LrgA family protein [Virgibacillus sp. LDC-1]